MWIFGKDILLSGCIDLGASIALVGIGVLKRALGIEQLEAIAGYTWGFL